MGERADELVLLNGGVGAELSFEKRRYDMQEGGIMVVC